MTEFILLFAWLVVFVIVVAFTYKIRHLISFYKTQEHEEKVESLVNSLNWFYALLVISALSGVGILYMFLKGTVWESHFFEWR